MPGAVGFASGLVGGLEGTKGGALILREVVASGNGGGGDGGRGGSSNSCRIYANCSAASLWRVDGGPVGNGSDSKGGDRDDKLDGAGDFDGVESGEHECVGDGGWTRGDELGRV